MAHESFEDAEVAGLMNEAFVCIKVDREERPDVDGIYMTVCQIMTGSGGWPLTILMTPERKPFFAGTYIPKENRHGRIGNGRAHSAESASSGRPVTGGAHIGRTGYGGPAEGPAESLGGRAAGRDCLPQGL